MGTEAQPDLDAIHKEVRESYDGWRHSLEAALKDENYSGVAEFAGYLQATAKRMHHLDPTRRVDDASRNSPSGDRYFIVWPDGKLVDYNYFRQRPAAMTHFNRQRQNLPEVRLWDDREKKWLEGGWRAS